MSNELLPCPFCGNELYRSPRNHNPKAYCVTEDCYGKRMSVVNLDDPIIVAMWNARAGAAAGQTDTSYWEFRNVVENLVFDPIRRGGRTEAEIVNQLKMMSEEHYAKPNCYTDVAATPTRDAMALTSSVIQKAIADFYPAWEPRPDMAHFIACRVLATAATPARDVTEAMALAGARSIGNTIHTDNHGVRARECWRAMWDARDGIVEPIPQGTLVSRPHGGSQHD